MRTLIVLALSILATALAGCGSDACEDAAAKLEECGVDAPEPKSSVECTGQDECIAQCFVDHGTCDDLDKTVIEANPEYRDCHLGCATE
jgi:hypothetical protein